MGLLRELRHCNRGSGSRLSCYRAAALGLLAWIAISHSSPLCAEPRVIGYETVSSARVGRTTYEYTMRVRVQNALPAYANGVFTVRSTSPSTEVVDGSVSLGDVLENTSATSGDTFRVRQDRTAAFDPSALVWRFEGQQLRGTLLSGSAAANALTSVVEFDDVEAFVSSAALENDGISTIARTRLGVKIASTATVRDVNQVLLAIRARIILMLPGSDFLVLAFPDPGSLAGLRNLQEQIRSSSAFAYAEFLGVAQPAELAPGVSVEDAAGAASQNLAIRAPAAWNARRALDSTRTQRPILLVADYFGGGMPLGAFGVRILRSTDFRNGPVPDDHGYHVLGIAAGRYADALDLVTGVFPADDLPIRAVDLSPANLVGALPTIPQVWQRLYNVVDEELRQSSTTHVVANLSLACAGTCTAADEEATGLFIARVQAATWHDRLFLIAAAGNLRIQASANSVFAQAASQLGGLTVESRDSTSGQPATVTPCLSTFGVQLGSNFGGDISAVGGPWILSFTTASGDAELMQGTSMAAPQVAGLTTYMWALRPELSASGIRSRILATAQTTELCTPTTLPQPQPAVDAYAAVLALDTSLDTAPARRAVLDVDGTNIFDQSDVNRYVSEWRVRNDGASDYSRYDLNGDSFTGGSRRTFFDLDANGHIESSVPVAGNPNHPSLDERGVTDAEVLCYYAFAWLPLSDAERANLKAQFPGVGACDGTSPVPPPSNRRTQVQTASVTGNVSGGYPTLYTPHFFGPFGTDVRPELRRFDQRLGRLIEVRGSVSSQMSGAEVSLTSNGGLLSAYSYTTGYGFDPATGETVLGGGSISPSVFACQPIIAQPGVQQTVGCSHNWIVSGHATSPQTLALFQGLGEPLVAPSWFFGAYVEYQGFVGYTGTVTFTVTLEYIYEPAS